MDMHKKVALTPIAGAVAAALCPAQQAVAQSDEFALEEIIVTATKRESNIQAIPASVQAITQESLAAMGARNVQDFSRFIPSINVVTRRPGDSTVVFRGAITGDSYIAQSTSSVYVDEISITTTGSQPSFRMVDIERVEALSGPQGTLYGSDAQAGTLRIITNKPVLNEFEAVIDLELRTGPDSDDSYRGSLVFNIPLVDDKLAMRLVGFNDHDGGFIDNVFGHTPDTPAAGVTGGSIGGFPGYGSYPAGFGTFDNTDVMEENWNDVDTYGARLGILWQMSDSWSINLTALTQTVDGGAGDNYDPFVGDLQVVEFHSGFMEDEYEMYSFVLNGDIGSAQLVASYNYYERDTQEMNDITVYGHYWQGIYCHDTIYTVGIQPGRTDGLDPDIYYVPVDAFYWENPDTGFWVYWPVYCMAQTIDGDSFQNYFEPFQQDKTTVEIRLSSQGETLDWIVGYYHEEITDDWQAPFAPPTGGGDGSVNLYQGTPSLEFMEFYFTNYYGAPTTYPDSQQWWYSQHEGDYAQDAIFGEVTWHINDSWALTLGGRYYDRTNDVLYIVDHPGHTETPIEGTGSNGEADWSDPTSREFRLDNNNVPESLSAEEQDFIPKIALAYSFGNDIGDDKMMYALYTQGTRPGGTNRTRGEPFFTGGYDGDLMDNYEIGYRSTFGNGRGRFNITAFLMEWSDYQLQLTDPSIVACNLADHGQELGSIPAVCGQPWQAIITNAGDAFIQGITFELDYAINDSWVFGMNLQQIEAETDTDADLTGNGELDLVAGLRLPLTPETKLASWLDFTTSSSFMGSEEAFLRFQVTYTSDSVNKLEPDGPENPNPQLTNDAYTIADIRGGWRGENWELALFVNNITDERATFNTQSGTMLWSASSVQDGRPHWQSRATNRPTEYGIRYMHRWGN